MNNLRTAQELLFKWISNFKSRSYDSIRENCDYLNIQYDLGIESYAVWKIFYPLVYSGIVDHVGGGYFASTEPLCYDFGENILYVGIEPRSFNNNGFVGLYLSNSRDDRLGCKILKFNAMKILKTFPSIDKIVNGFHESIFEEKDFEFHDYKNKCGVAELRQGGLVRCFSIPNILYQRQIPDKSMNPDALNISYYYERVVNKIPNGHYNSKTNVLRLESFGMPILLFRVLLLNCCSNGVFPKQSGYEYIFEQVNSKLVDEINRIICNSIKNE